MLGVGVLGSLAAVVGCRIVLVERSLAVACNLVVGGIAVVLGSRIGARRIEVLHTEVVGRSRLGYTDRKVRSCLLLCRSCFVVCEVYEQAEDVRGRKLLGD